MLSVSIGHIVARMKEIVLMTNKIIFMVFVSENDVVNERLFRLADNGFRVAAKSQKTENNFYKYFIFCQL